MMNHALLELQRQAQKAHIAKWEAEHRVKVAQREVAEAEEEIARVQVEIVKETLRTLGEAALASAAHGPLGGH